ncbi:hypothetical protein EDB89DRAFT_2239556 [Lactarius sanguifluus]|nr:hypothetical protein EDB89DRAFT_2239556 [Lactarius sanguifluus]
MSLSPPKGYLGSNAKPEQPSTAFQDASERRIAWLIQTTPPVERRLKNWEKYRNAGDNSSRVGLILQVSDSLTFPHRKVLGLDVGKWGPSVDSARSCSNLPASKMFEGFVLSWLYTRPDVKPLRCFSTDQVGLEIPACGEEQTTFSSKNGLEKFSGVFDIGRSGVTNSAGFPNRCSNGVLNENLGVMIAELTDETNVAPRVTGNQHLTTPLWRSTI